MRIGLSLARGIAAVLVSGAVAAACSASGGSKTTGGHNGTGASSSTGATGGIVIGAGTTGTGAVNVGGSGGSDGNPMLTNCTKTSECDKNFVCVLTSPDKGVCSPNGGACTPTGTECVNDTFCCIATDGCNIDGVTDPTCVSNAARPVNEMCKNAATVSQFSPDLQCAWRGPVAGDPFMDSINVLTTPLVANLPTESGTAAEIVVVSSTSGESGGHIRILNGQTCEQIEVIQAGGLILDAATPSIADLDGDGKLEIVARLNAGGVVAFKFDGTKYDQMWTQPAAGPGGKTAWDGVSIHDLDDDGKPEIIGAGGVVLNGTTGAVIAAANPGIFLASDPALGDLDGDGKIELVANKVFRWSGTAWAEAYPGLNTTKEQTPAFFAFADFGTRTGAGQFDPTKLDGKAEVVGVGPVGNDESTGVVRIATLEGDKVLDVSFPKGPQCQSGQATGERGGPPTIGDFDGDGMPELASAGGYAYRVFDLGCDAGCKDPANKIRWASPTQDCSSAMTGSTIFDFEGDGKAEAVYADECFVRVYDGKTGDVKFSTPRSSATWWEQPVVADPDNSDRSKIIYGGAALYYTFSNCGRMGAALNCEDAKRPSGCIDPLWAGVTCQKDDECVSGKCDSGYCRCTTDAECGNPYMYNNAMPNDVLVGLGCQPPKAGTPGTGNVCRAEFGDVTTFPVAQKDFAGVFVYRDKLDRWASSRNLWNQHAYSITNIEDNGSVPKTSAWKQNYKEPGLNNYRQNRQGATSQDLADITGALDASNACTLTADNKVIFTGRICNRGLRGVGSNMPAAFYLGDDRTTPLCKTETPGPVPKGGCQNIECTIPKTDVPTNSKITMIVNDVGGGNRLVDECNYDNNVANVVVEKCQVVK
ncbi:MAG TPA: VCBS repeat-containing protein [Polyangiaceae bacterium]|nr:VCBS repeat-containing protein [Polyangiaceae bacterium]